MRKIITYAVILLATLASLGAASSILTVSDGDIDALELFSPGGELLDPVSDIDGDGYILRTKEEGLDLTMRSGDILLGPETILTVPSLENLELYLIDGQLNVILTGKDETSVYTPSSLTLLEAIGEYVFVSTDEEESTYNFSASDITTYDALTGKTAVLPPLHYQNRAVSDEVLKIGTEGYDLLPTIPAVIYVEPVYLEEAPAEEASEPVAAEEEVAAVEEEIPVTAEEEAAEPVIAEEPDAEEEAPVVISGTVAGYPVSAICQDGLAIIVYPEILSTDDVLAFFNSEIEKYGSDSNGILCLVDVGNTFIVVPGVPAETLAAFAPVLFADAEAFAAGMSAATVEETAAEEPVIIVPDIVEEERLAEVFEEEISGYLITVSVLDSTMTVEYPLVITKADAAAFYAYELEKHSELESVTYSLQDGSTIIHLPFSDEVIVRYVPVFFSDIEEYVSLLFQPEEEVIEEPVIIVPDIIEEEEERLPEVFEEEISGYLITVSVLDNTMTVEYPLVITKADAAAFYAYELEKLSGLESVTYSLQDGSTIIHLPFSDEVIAEYVPVFYSDIEEYIDVLFPPEEKTGPVIIVPGKAEEEEETERLPEVFEEDICGYLITVSVLDSTMTVEYPLVITKADAVAFYAYELQKHSGLESVTYSLQDGSTIIHLPFSDEVIVESIPVFYSDIEEYINMLFPAEEEVTEGPVIIIPGEEEEEAEVLHAFFEEEICGQLITVSVLDGTMIVQYPETITKANAAAFFAQGLEEHEELEDVSYTISNGMSTIYLGLPDEEIIENMPVFFSDFEEFLSQIFPAEEAEEEIAEEEAEIIPLVFEEDICGYLITVSVLDGTMTVEYPPVITKADAASFFAYEIAKHSELEDVTYTISNCSTIVRLGLPDEVIAENIPVFFSDIEEYIGLLFPAVEEEPEAPRVPAPPVLTVKQAQLVEDLPEPVEEALPEPAEELPEPVEEQPEPVEELLAVEEEAMEEEAAEEAKAAMPAAGLLLDGLVIEDVQLENLTLDKTGNALGIGSLSIGSFSLGSLSITPVQQQSAAPQPEPAAPAAATEQVEETAEVDLIEEEEILSVPALEDDYLESLEMIAVPVESSPSGSDLAIPLLGAPGSGSDARPVENSPVIGDTASPVPSEEAPYVNAEERNQAVRTTAVSAPAGTTVSVDTPTMPGIAPVVNINVGGAAPDGSSPYTIAPVVITPVIINPGKEGTELPFDIAPVVNINVLPATEETAKGGIVLEHLIQGHTFIVTLKGGTVTTECPETVAQSKVAGFLYTQIDKLSPDGDFTLRGNTLSITLQLSQQEMFKSFLPGYLDDLDEYFSYLPSKELKVSEKAPKETEKKKAEPEEEEPSEHIFDIRLAGSARTDSAGDSAPELALLPVIESGNFSLEISLDTYRLYNGIKDITEGDMEWQDWLAFGTDFFNELRYDNGTVGIALDRKSDLAGDPLGLVPYYSRGWDRAYESLNFEHYVETSHYSHRMWLEDAAFHHSGSGTSLAGLDFCFSVFDEEPVSLHIGTVALLDSDDFGDSLLYPEISVLMPFWKSGDNQVALRYGGSLMIDLDDIGANPFTDNGYLALVSFPVRIGDFGFSVSGIYQSGGMHYRAFDDGFYEIAEEDTFTLAIDFTYSNRFFGLYAYGMADGNADDIIIEGSGFAGIEAYAFLKNVKLLAGFQGQGFDHDPLDFDWRMYVGIQDELGPVTAYARLIYDEDDWFVKAGGSVSVLGKAKEQTTTSLMGSLPLRFELETGMQEYFISDDDPFGTPVALITPMLTVDTGSFSIGFRIPLRVTFDENGDWHFQGNDWREDFNFGVDTDNPVYNFITDTFSLIDHITIGNEESTIYLLGEDGYIRDSLLFSNYGARSELALRFGVNVPHFSMELYVDDLVSPRITELVFSTVPVYSYPMSIQLSIAGETLWYDDFGDFLGAYYPGLDLKFPVTDGLDVRAFAYGSVDVSSASGYDNVFIYDDGLSDWLAGAAVDVAGKHWSVSVAAGYRDSKVLKPDMFNAILHRAHYTLRSQKSDYSEAGWAKVSFGLSFKPFDFSIGYSIDDLERTTRGDYDDAIDMFSVEAKGRINKNVTIWGRLAVKNFNDVIAKADDVLEDFIESPETAWSFGIDFDFGRASFSASVQNDTNTALSDYQVFTNLVPLNDTATYYPCYNVKLTARVSF